MSISSDLTNHLRTLEEAIATGRVTPEFLSAFAAGLGEIAFRAGVIDHVIDAPATLPDGVVDLASHMYRRRQGTRRTVRAPFGGGDAA